MPTHLADKVVYHFDLLKRERTQMLWKVAKVKKITILLNLKKFRLAQNSYHDNRNTLVH